MKESIFLITVIVLAIALGAVVAFPIMLLWNGCLVGAVVGVNEITYLQSWGLYLLSHLMFKFTLSAEKKV